MTPRVALPCSGLGRTRRGYERFTEELAAALRGRAEVRVYAGALPPGLPGRSIPCLPRSALAAMGMDEKRAYYWEQVTFALAFAPALAVFRPQIAHVCGPTILNVLLRVGRRLRHPPRLVFCNASDRSPSHYTRYDHVQLVTPWQVSQAEEVGFDPKRISLVPLGVETAKYTSPADRAGIRRRLSLPEGLLGITVAALDRAHKRIDYLVEEFADPAASDWSLICLGERTRETPGLEEQARRLAPGRIQFRTVAGSEIPSYLAASDLFLFASSQEPFGLALVEAMASGLPVVARDLPSFRYILDDPAQLDPLVERGALLRHLAEARSAEVRAARGARNRKVAVDRFDWRSLVPSYLAMYEQALSAPS